MVLVPHLIIDGMDASRYLLTAHCEMTANGSKDPGKYDLTLADPGGIFYGAFGPKSIEATEQEQLGNWDLAPKKKVFLQMIETRAGCEAGADNTTTIFSGEIQKAEADEVYCRIEGSCTEGGMTSRIKPRTWPTGTPITTIVNDLLDMFGGIPQNKRHILPYKNDTDDITPELREHLDFDTALYEVSCWAQSIYFFDENDDFWFCPATDLRGFSDLTGRILRGTSAANMVGNCNFVEVYGGAPEDLSEIKTHKLIYAFAKAPDWEIQTYGLLKAPPVTLPNVSQERAQQVANNLLEWYRQYKDVPTIKVVNRAPGLLSKVSFQPWNGHAPPLNCDGLEGATMAPVMGLVTRRVVDISAESGFVSSLDVATRFLDAGVPVGEDDIKNFYSQNQNALEADPGVSSAHPGVTYA